MRAVHRSVAAALRRAPASPAASAPRVGGGILGLEGEGSEGLAADINGDGEVDVLDLIEVLLAFGTACP